MSANSLNTQSRNQHSKSIAKLPNFDALKQLAQNSPNALEQLRQEHIDALITSAPESYRKRLRGLQFQIDGQRHISKSPMQSCIKISQMMHESFHDLREKLQELAQQNLSGSQAIGQNLDQEFDRIEGATILSFPAKV